MSHQTASGATLGISAAAPATHDIAGFDALTFTDVGEITNIGEFGKEWETVTHSPLSSRGVKKSKGSFNNGALSPGLALDDSDAGQAIMEAARDSDDNYYFKITLKSGLTYYFVGLVMSFKPNVGGNPDVVTASTNIELNNHEIVKKPAA
ncbi:MAG: hypothetical protein MRY77_10115 [Rhodobacteraceae bacterium]|nr:hypothetical protein [Paracoccaceae bacterium]